jgi:hypothetical protein
MQVWQEQKVRFWQSLSYDRSAHTHMAWSSSLATGDYGWSTASLDAARRRHVPAVIIVRRMNTVLVVS